MINTAPVRAVTSRIASRNVAATPGAMAAKRTVGRAVRKGMLSEANDWLHEHGFNEGGRVGYRRGGKVSGLEPLVQSLLRKYKVAKGIETRGTEPLLDQSDQTIVKALDVAKKAI